MKPSMNHVVGAIALAALLTACGGGPSNGVPLGTSPALSLAGAGSDTGGAGSGTSSSGGDTSGTGSSGGTTGGGGTAGTGDGGGTGGSGSTGGGTTPPSDPVTDAVTDSHSDATAQFNEELQASLQDLANQGTLCTDNGAKQILGKKISSLTHFVDNVAAIVTAAVQAGQPVDKQALIDLLNQYRAEDKEWLANPQQLLEACGWSLEEFTATKAQNSNSIDSLYDGLISLIQSL
jgi:hypothetical protein